MNNVNNKKLPVFLLADSQLLFYFSEDGLFLDRIKELLKSNIKNIEVKAAYIGASNNDNPQYFEIFQMAMQQIDIHNCRMIKSCLDEDDTVFLKNSDIILLAGGDPEKGWNAMLLNGWNDIITEKYSNGAILIGISAGAIQLGVRSFKGLFNKNSSVDSLQVVPFIIDVHADDLWQGLTDYLLLQGDGAKGIGIPFGAGLVYSPDESFEAIRFECVEFQNVNGFIKKSHIKPLKTLSA